MQVIGITGGVGAGKSRVLDYIRSHCNCRIVLADEVGNQVKEPGTECFFRLVELLGTEILTGEGRIDKGKMAEVIFGNRELLKEVNAMIHPAVRKFILEAIEEERTKGQIDCFFVEAALLIECGYSEVVEELWYIYATEDVRRQRLQDSRQYSEEKIRRIMAGQLQEEEFRKSCHHVIDNSGMFTDTEEQIRNELLRLQLWREK